RRIAAMLAGRLEGLPDSLTGLSTTGLLKDETPASIEEWIEAAVGGGLLAATDDTYRTLSLTRIGREVMAGRSTSVELTLRHRPREARGLWSGAAHDCRAAIEFGPFEEVRWLVVEFGLCWSWPAFRPRPPPRRLAGISRWSRSCRLPSRRTSSPPEREARSR